MGYPNISSTKDRLREKLIQLRESAKAEILKIKALPANEISNIDVKASIKKIEQNFNEIINKLTA